MSWSPQLDAILVETNVTGDFKTWLCQNGVLSRKDFGLADRNDKAFVDTELVTPSGLQTISANIAVRKAWGVAEAAEQHESEAAKTMLDLPENGAITPIEARFFFCLLKHAS